MWCNELDRVKQQVREQTEIITVLTLKVGKLENEVARLKADLKMANICEEKAKNENKAYRIRVVSFIKKDKDIIHDKDKEIADLKAQLEMLSPLIEKFCNGDDPNGKA